MRMVGCVSTPTSGELRILGMDPAVDGPRDPAPARRRAAGRQPRHRADRPRQPAHLRALLRPPAAEIRRRSEELLEFMQLTDRRNDLVDPLSGGMKRRLTIGRALINQPDLLLLDEPTTGLDPQARHLLWDRFYRLKRDGVTMVLTTHYMEEAEQLCDRLVIMDGGRIVTEGSPRELVANGTRRVRSSSCASPRPRSATARCRVWRSSASGSRRSPTACSSTPQDAGKVVGARRPTASCTPSRCTSGAARSRTSSSSSPAARWRTDVSTPARAAGRREGVGRVAAALEGVGVPGDDLAAAVPRRDGAGARRPGQQGLGRSRRRRLPRVRGARA